MPNLEDSLAISGLRNERPPEVSPRILTAEQVRDAIYAEAEHRGQPYRMNPDAWLRTWIASRKFFLMDVPVNCVALPCKPRDMEQAEIRISAATDKPIYVDVNKPGVGRDVNNGFTPPITVIDGKHRLWGANRRGDTYIKAWIGELAAQRIDARTAFQRSKYHSGFRHAHTPLDRAMELTVQADSEPLHHILGRELGMDPVEVRRMIADYKTVHATSLRERMNAVSPPGWSKTVEKMKKHPEIDNPFALAWHMHDHGYRPHKKD